VKSFHQLPLFLRVLGELSIIVLGVMIALSADAFLAERAERISEVEHLVALHSDLVQSREILAESEAERVRLLYSLERLLVEDLNSVPADSVSLWVYDGFWIIGTFAPRLSSLRDLQTSGEVSILSADVRIGLAELDQSLDELIDLEDDFARSQQGLLDPYVTERMPLAPILAVADSLPIPDSLSETPDWSSLLTAQARNLMAFKLSLGKIGAQRRQRFRAEMTALMEVLEGRLEELGHGM
jgi:hypothetical protein